MTRITTKTSIIAITALMITIGLPSAFAHTSLETYYWNNNANVCYLETELNTLRWGPSGGTGAAEPIKQRIGIAVSTYNAYMDSVTLNNNDTCSGNRIEFGAQDLAMTYLASEFTIFSGNTITRSDVDYNTDFTFHGDSNQCIPNYDVEWVANHELGHSVGLAHTTHHSPPSSVMTPNCDGVWSTIQSSDATALDTHYS